jgi:hypothetical protein
VSLREIKTSCTRRGHTWLSWSLNSFIW